ncbi:MAG: hypothetical protein H3C34_04950, partial [Caldilineaceae bacterium]|nr:hypothetical protein [Caldilineaceae bacterium]
TANAQFGGAAPFEPYAATATAAAIFGVPLPFDPFAVTATANAQFGGAAPFEPYAATATAAAIFGVPLPFDPFAVTATANALSGGAVYDPFGETATALALTAVAPTSPLETPLPALATEVAAAPPQATVIFVTATPTPEATGPATQRPVAPPTAGPSGDSRAVFRTILDAAAAATVFIWLALGTVALFVVAGVLAGLSLANPERRRFDLSEEGEVPTDLQPAPPTASGQPTDDEEWPASLP